MSENPEDWKYKRHGYKDWCYLNDKGKELFGDIFPDGIVPILSMIPITFEHPELDKPNQAYLLKGRELTEEQTKKLVNTLAEKFNTMDNDSIEYEISVDQIPIRITLTSGSGTRRPNMYME